jgi:hypothetical protein
MLTGDDARERVRAFLKEHDPAAIQRQDFLNARWDAGVAWVHYPVGKRRPGRAT